MLIKEFSQNFFSSFFDNLLEQLPAIFWLSPLTTECPILYMTAKCNRIEIALFSSVLAHILAIAIY